ncbi:MAG: hypothetical protein M3R55_13235 [Acidobacteriota bacterium]|nr:hypothetical protein [Acidobacteriota bacterium]
MRRISTLGRLLLLMWLVLGAALWNGVYDYVNSRGYKEYLYRNAELRLGIQPPPGKSADLRTVLDAERKNAMLQGTVWALLIVTAGFSTIWLLTRIEE